MTSRPTLPFFPGWILPLGILSLTFSFDISLPDPFHAWRWTLICLTAALGLLFLALGRKRPSLPPVRLALVLVAGFAGFSLLSLSVVRNIGEGLWQVAQVLGWCAWLLYALFAGAAYPTFWVRLRDLAVVFMMLGGAFAILDYWGFWSPGRGLGLGPGGLQGNRNLLASFLFLLCPWVLWVILVEVGYRRLSAYLAWGVFAYSLAITQTRAVWLGAFMMVASILALSFLGSRVSSPIRRSAYARVAMWLAAPVLAAFFIHGQIRPTGDNREGSLARAASVADPSHASNAQRLALWSKTLTLIEEHPWLGVGPGHWKIALPSTGMSGLLWPDMSLTEVRPYNDWLWVTSETGVPGGLCWLGLWLAALVAGVRVIRSAGRESRIPATLFTAGLAGFGMVMALDFPRERPEHMAWYALSLGYLLHAGSKENAPSAPGLRIPSRFRLTAGPVLAAISLVAMAATVLGIWRLKQEAKVGDILAAHAVKDWGRVLEAADLVDPRICAFNPAASPIEWHAGIARHQMGDREGAEKAFLRSLERHPWHLPTLYNLAVTRLAAGDTAGAISRLDQALEISPGFTEAALGRAQLSLRRGELRPARRALSGIGEKERGPRRRALDGLTAMERNEP